MSWKDWTARSAVAALALVMVICVVGCGSRMARQDAEDHSKIEARQNVSSAESSAKSDESDDAKDIDKTDAGDTTSDHKQDTSRDRDSRQSDQTMGATSSAQPARIIASSYEFDLPAQWAGRVSPIITGDEVCLTSTAYPRRDIATISVADGPEPESRGDIVSSLIGYVPIDATRHIEVWATRWPALAAYQRLDTNQQTGGDMLSDAEGIELTDLQYGGGTRYLPMVETMVSSDMRDCEALFDMDEYLCQHLVSAIVAR